MESKNFLFGDHQSNFFRFVDNLTYLTKFSSKNTYRNRRAPSVHVPAVSSVAYSFPLDSSQLAEEAEATCRLATF